VIDVGHAKDVAGIERDGRGACRHQREHHQLAPGAEIHGTAVGAVVEGHEELVALARPDHPERPRLRLIDRRDVDGGWLRARVERQGGA